MRESGKIVALRGETHGEDTTKKRMPRGISGGERHPRWLDNTDRILPAGNLAENEGPVRGTEP
mgnify:CR=1 FL=1